MIAVFVIFLLATSSLVALGIFIGTKKEDPKVLVLQLSDQPNVQLAVDTYSCFAELVLDKSSYAIHRLHTFEDVEWAIRNAQGNKIILYSHGDKDKGFQIDDSFIPWMHLVDAVLECPETEVFVCACYSGVEYSRQLTNYHGWYANMDAEYAGWLGAIISVNDFDESYQILDRVTQDALKKQREMKHPLGWPIPHALTSVFARVTRKVHSTGELNWLRREDQAKYGNAPRSEGGVDRGYEQDMDWDTTRPGYDKFQIDVGIAKFGILRLYSQIVYSFAQPNWNAKSVVTDKYNDEAGFDARLIYIKIFFN